MLCCAVLRCVWGDDRKREGDDGIATRQSSNHGARTGAAGGECTRRGREKKKFTYRLERLTGGTDRVSIVELPVWISSARETFPNSNLPRMDLEHSQILPLIKSNSIMGFPIKPHQGSKVARAPLHHLTLLGSLLLLVLAGDGIFRVQKAAKLSIRHPCTAPVTKQLAPF